MSFEQLELPNELLRALQDKGYVKPTPVQLEAIPPILRGKDAMVTAQTGTGKTAGFTVPIWLSIFGFMFASALSVWMFKEAIKP